MDDFLAGETEEYVTRIVVDVSTRTFIMHSNEGQVKEVSCESAEEFMNVLTFVRDFDDIGLLGENVLHYAEPKGLYS